MKQINIFGEIDIMNDDEEIIETKPLNECSECGEPCEGDVCSDECGSLWIKKYFPE